MSTWRTISLTTGQTLPETGSRTGAGYPGTGATLDPTDYSFWGGYGTARASSAAGIVHLSADLTTIRDYYSVASLGISPGSVQGVAYDSSDDTIWFILKLTTRGTRLVHMTKDGSLISDRGLRSADSNGLAYDSTRDQLIVMKTTGTVNWIDKETLDGTGKSFTATGRNNDQLAYDPARDELLVSGGANGTDGTIKRYDVSGSRATLIETITLEGADAIEGIVLYGNDYVVWNDAATHPGNPPENRVLVYSGVMGPSTPPPTLDQGGRDLTGDEAANMLIGHGDDDVLNGLGGNDTLDGRGGADTLNGGTGVDTASYAASRSGVIVDLAAGVGQGGDAQGDRLLSIENVIGSGFADRLIGDGSANRLEGGDGDDRLDGGDGNDSLEGGAGNDMINGGAGDDTLVLSGRRADYAFSATSGGELVITDLRAGQPDGVDRATNVESLQFTGGAPIFRRAAVGTHSNDYFVGTSADDAFFFDTAVGLGQGTDTIRNFAMGDRIVTTSPFLDRRGNGQISAGSNDRFVFAGTLDGSVSATGSLKLLSSSGSLVTKIRLVGTDVRDGMTFYVYGGAYDTATMADLDFGPSTPPTVAITSSKSVLAAGESATLTFTFSDTPLDFAVSDIEVGSGRLGMLMATDDPHVFTVDYTPRTNLREDSLVIGITAGAFTDAFGKANVATSSIALQVNTISDEPIFPGTSGADVFAANNDANWSISGAGGDDILGGAGGNDTLLGGDGKDRLSGGGGDDRIDGGADVDTLLLSGSRSDYSFLSSGGTLTIRDLRAGSPDGTDSVTGIEAISFAEGAGTPSGARVSGAGNDSYRGTSSADTYFYDTALGLGLGLDTIRDFSVGDRIVTTSSFPGLNASDQIKAGSNDRFKLPAGIATDASAGQVKVYSTSGGIVSTLELLGTETEAGISYYIYGLVHDTTARAPLF